MVSKAQVLSASRPDLSDIITLQASGVPDERERQTGKAVSKVGRGTQCTQYIKGDILYHQV